MEYSKLKGRIVEKYGTQEQFASRLSISSQTLSKKMNGHSNFSQSDILSWCKALDIDPQEIGLYFFSELSSKV